MVNLRKIEGDVCKCGMKICKKSASWIYEVDGNCYKQIFPACSSHLIGVFTKVLDAINFDDESDILPKVNI